MRYSLNSKEIYGLLNFNYKDATAVHGTSIEAIEILIKTGKLPSSDSRWEHRHPKNQIDYRKGNLYFVPFKSKFVGFEFYENLSDLKNEEIIQDAKSYAKILASRNYLANILPFKPYDDPGFYFDEWYCSSIKPPLVIEAEQHGLSENKFQEFLEKSYKRKGVLVFTSDDFLNLPVEIEDEREITTHVPSGLGIGYILGLESLGTEEKSILNKWIKN